jgi:RNA recognition motif-containing protein
LELGAHDLAAAAAAVAAGGADPADHAGSSGGGLGAALPSAAALADLAPVDSPSRTLLVQNVSQEVSDEELRRLFAAHGDLRMLYTAAKACGLVIVGYFDLRAAMAATNALQGFLLAGRRLDVAYSAPKKGEVNQINQVCVCGCSVARSSTVQYMLHRSQHIRLGMLSLVSCRLALPATLSVLI